MRRLATFACLAIAFVLVAQLAHAQYQYGSRHIRNGIVSPTAASRLGLKRAWFTQIELDRSRARVSHVRQHVSKNRFATKFVVTWPDGEEVYTETSVDQFGDPLGLEGAEKAAKARVTELKDQDIQADLETVMVPEVTIYVSTDRATLHALDGATGRTKWVTTVGNRNHPTLAPGANDRFVGVLNGSNLFVLEQASGKVVWTRQMDKPPGAGPALTDDRIYVPTVGGKMEVYELEDHRRPPWYYQATGRLLVQPTVATNSVSWATDRGYLYVGGRERPGVRYRLETREAITAPATYLPPKWLFTASIDGYAYCVHEFNGEIRWRFSAGDPISQSPVVTQDAAYIVADGAGLYRINPENGLEQWYSPRVSKVLAASTDRVYCAADGGRFVILDAKTGGRIDSMSLLGLDVLHTNWQTDRIYVGTDTGVLQCLHELGARWPTVHNIPDPEESARPEVIQRKEGEPADEEKEKPADPFGGADDPFAGPADPFAEDAGDDPFAGGGEDPFGGGDDDGPAADPFGGGDAGGADPFGGGDDAGGGDDPFGGGGADNPFG